MPENEGKAYVAGWIIKVLAVAFLAATIAWGDNVNTTAKEAAVKVAKVEERVNAMDKQLDRIENKIDKIRR